MKSKKIKDDEYRCGLQTLDDVCLDCCDYINTSFYGCGHCSVSKLKDRIKKLKEVKR